MCGGFSSLFFFDVNGLVIVVVIVVKLSNRYIEKVTRKQIIMIRKYTEVYTIREKEMFSLSFLSFGPLRKLYL